MLSSKKTKKMEIIGEGKNKTYGTSDNKADQKKYEEKVNIFLSYCMNFENSLVRENRNGGINSVEKILVCFKQSFKDYYKKFSKKFSIFSSTTGVLNKMEKELKKIKNKKLSDSGISTKVIRAFKYESKRDYGKDYGSRAAIYDQAVYKFFNNEIPEIIGKICQKQLNESDEQSDSISFINKMLKKTEKISKQTNEVQQEILDVQQTAEERVASLNELKNQLENWKKNAIIDDKDIEKRANKIGEQIDRLQRETKNIERELEKLDDMMVDLDNGKDILKKLLELKNGEKLTDKEKKDLKNVGIDDIKDMKKIEEAINNVVKQVKQAGDIWDGLYQEKSNVEERIKNLKIMLEKVIKENKEKLGKLVTLNKMAGSLTINGNDGLELFLNHCSGEGREQLEYCKLMLESVTLNNIRDISSCVKSNNVFNICENLTSVTTNNLSGTIGKSPFSHCNKLGKFNEKNGYNYNIPKSVTTIGPWAFEYTGKEVQNGFSANIEATNICEGAFYGSGLAKINLPNATKIESNAFSNCVKLTEVILGKNVTIGSSAFEGCINLSKVTLSKDISEDKRNNLKSIICTQTKKPEKDGNNNGIEFTTV